MPLTGENRVIARLGLEQMRQRPVAGIRALSKVSGVKTEDLTSGRIGFSLAPRLNAGGRLVHADRAVKLLAAASDEEAELLAMELDRLNVDRRDLVDQTVIEADEMWQSLCAAEGGARRNVIVLAKDGWNAGIAGLVASKLVERYYRPVIILAVDLETGLCKGSARSIDGFDLFAALTENADLMDHYGGHQAAAGMTISREKVKTLSNRLHLLAEQWLDAEDWQPKRRVDLSISLRDVTLKAVEQLSRLEPFGNGNPTPRVVIPNVVILESRTMGKDNKHLRITVEQNGQSMEAVGFGMGDERIRLTPGTPIDLLGELSVNEWNGNRRVQVMVQDFRSKQLQLHDRRRIQNLWSTVESIVMNDSSGVVIGCASANLFEEATSRVGHMQIPICTYADIGSGVDDQAVMESAAELEQMTFPLKGWRQLILLGLPSSEAEISTLIQWLAPDRGGESVYVFSDSHVPGKTDQDAPAFPERKHFAEIYAIFRKRGVWLDTPDGFLQETALTTGWPLSTLRMMQEVFVELGFIAVDGSTLTIVSVTPRRELEESARFRKAKEQHDGMRLTEFTTEQLRKWFADHHITSQEKRV
jgi:single-stranded-DNA-specific exonuclease